MASSHPDLMRAWRVLRAGEATLPLHLFPPPPHVVLADGLAGPGREGLDALLPLRVTKFGSARVAL